MSLTLVPVKYSNNVLVQYVVTMVRLRVNLYSDDSHCHCCGGRLFLFHGGVAILSVLVHSSFLILTLNISIFILVIYRTLFTSAVSIVMETTFSISFRNLCLHDADATVLKGWESLSSPWLQ